MNPNPTPYMFHYRCLLPRWEDARGLDCRKMSHSAANRRLGLRPFLRQSGTLTLAVPC
jgi:hypothetical protein